MSSNDDHVLALLHTVEHSGRFPTDAISAYFRRHFELTDRDRGEITERLYGLIRQARRTRFALEGVTTPADLHPRTRLLTADWIEGRGTLEQARAVLPAIDWDRIADHERRIDELDDPVERLGVLRSVPDHLAQLFLAEHGPRAAPLLEALNRTAPQTIRTNTSKLDRDALASQLANEGLRAHACRFAATALRIDPPGALFKTAAFAQGMFEVQDEGSQLIAELVAPPPGATVIDACAGAGGKTLALAALLRGRGRVLALDVSAPKLEELRRRARRAGASNVRALQLDATGPLPDAITALGGKVERVLVDAPCSGLGVLRRNPDARWRITPEELARLPVLQLEIVERFLPLLAPGGRLIYATCTLRSEENDALAAAVLARHPELEQVRIAEIHGKRWAEPLTGSGGFALKLDPLTHGTDGFYATVFRRRR